MKDETVIRRGELYGKSEACRRLGWGRASWRSAIRKGLKVSRHGRLAYVTGDEIVRFLAAEPGAEG